MFKKKKRRGRPKGSRNKPKEPVVKIKIQSLMDKEGIYTSPSEDSFKSKEDIQVEKMYSGRASVNYPDRQLGELTFEELHGEFARRAELRQKVENKEYNATIEIETDHPIGINWLADVHIPNQQVDYERLKWEIDEIKAHPYMKVALGGDLADAFVWNPAQFGDVGNLTEQNLYIHRMLEYLGWDKILFAVVGNHCKWSRRMGLDMYHDLRDKIPVFDGTGTIDLYINKQLYIGAALHKAKGSSYLDPNYQQKRFLRENEGYDWVFTAHTHEGGEQSLNKYTNRGMRKAVVLSGKTFKMSDDFQDTEGKKIHTHTGIGTNGVIFHHDKNMMIPVSSMYEMLELLK